MITVKDTYWDGRCKFCGDYIKFKNLKLVEKSEKYYRVKKLCPGCRRKITIRDLIKSP